MEALHSEKESLICPLTLLILSEPLVHDLSVSTLSFLKTTSLSMAMSAKGFNISIEETDLQPRTKVNAPIKPTYEVCKRWVLFIEMKFSQIARKANKMGPIWAYMPSAPMQQSLTSLESARFGPSSITVLSGVGITRHLRHQVWGLLVFSKTREGEKSVLPLANIHFPGFHSCFVYHRNFLIQNWNSLQCGTFDLHKRTHKTVDGSFHTACPRVNMIWSQVKTLAYRTEFGKSKNNKTNMSELRGCWS